MTEAHHRIQASRELNPQAVELAELLCLAVRIEPKLIRHARLLVPNATVAAEADLWSSPMVEAQGPDGLMLQASVAEALRASIRGKPAVLRQAWALTQDSHRDAPWSLRFEEAINYLSVAEAEDRLEQIRQLLDAASRELLNGEASLDVGRWLARALRRMPTEVRRLPATSQLERGVAMRLHGRIEHDTVPLNARDYEWVQSMLPPDLGTVTVGFRLAGGAFEIGPLSPERAYAVDVPRTSPLALRLSWDEPRQGDQVLLFEEGTVARVSMPAPIFELRTLLGVRLQVRTQEAPADGAVPYFLSFAPEDRSEAGTIRRALASASFETVERSLDRAVLALLVISNAALASRRVQLEWSLASQRKLALVPILLENVERSRLPLEILAYRLRDFRDPGRRVQQLKDLLDGLDGREVPVPVSFPAGLLPGNEPVPPELERTVQLLTDRSSTEDAHVVAVVGRPEREMTVLATAVCSHSEVRSRFAQGIHRVQLGMIPDLESVLVSLIGQLTGSRPPAASLRTLQNQLADLLRGRDILLVLDDLWDEHHGVALGCSRTSGATLITTHSTVIAQRLGARVLQPEKRQLPATPAPLGPGGSEILEAAEQAFGAGRWEEAFKHYQTMLVHYRENLTDADIVDIFCRIGDVKTQTGESNKAINMYSKALEISPRHEPAHRALIDLYLQTENWSDAARQKEMLLFFVDDSQAKLALYTDLIAIYRDRLKDRNKTIQACLGALELSPDPGLLETTAQLLSDGSQWRESVALHVKMAEKERDPAAAARYLRLAADISRNRLGATTEAVELYARALDRNPEDLGPLAEMGEIFASSQDWKSQERAYRRMLQRLGQEVPPKKRSTQIKLWQGLGDIYRLRLNDYSAAAQAYEVAVNLEPTSIDHRKLLAEMHERCGPEAYDKAIDARRAIVSSTGDMKVMAEQLKALYRMYTELGQYDRAWCVASVLCFLAQADGEERQFFTRYKPMKFVGAKNQLSEEQWHRNLYHPWEDRVISTVLSAVSHQVALQHSLPHKKWGLKRKDRRDVATDMLLFSKVFNYVTLVLAVPQPEVFLFPESPGQLELVNAQEKGQLCPGIKVGADLLRGRPEQELLCILGTRLSLMRPDHFLRWPSVVPGVAELRVVYLAAIRIARPHASVPTELESQVRAQTEYFSRTLSPQSKELLEVIAERYPEPRSGTDFMHWTLGVEFTKARAGYLLSGDLVLAAKLIQEEPRTAMPAARERIRDLVKWTISDEYFALRDRLGLTIG